ncbi:MAG: hypothetical protein FWD60_07875 [Candidatus Azobacteroides sp.]|nr:hypothetical protein [Candidatus Azobacteroides sp.]
MYVDFDYECLASFDSYILEKRNCYFAMEPEEHRLALKKDIYFNNALMIASPRHLFFKSIINHLHTKSVIYTESKFLDVLSSTGPMMLTTLYEKYKDKSSVSFFSSEQVSPWSKNEVSNYINGNASLENLAKKLEKAIAIHYFFGTWL